MKKKDTSEQSNTLESAFTLSSSVFQFFTPHGYSKALPSQSRKKLAQFVWWWLTFPQSVLTLRTGDQDREPDTSLWLLQSMSANWSWRRASGWLPAPLSLQESKVPSPGRNKLLVFPWTFKACCSLNRLIFWQRWSSVLPSLVVDTLLRKITYDHVHKAFILF